jgi:hypothetical protein
MLTTRLATGWTVWESNPGGGEIFRACPGRPWGPPSLLYNSYRVFPGGKERPGRGADPSPPSSAVGHERVELYLYSPLWAVWPVQRASVPVQGCTLPLLKYINNNNILVNEQFGLWSNSAAELASYNTRNFKSFKWCSWRYILWLWESFWLCVPCNFFYRNYNFTE